MLYDRFAESPATQAIHQRRLHTKFLPDLDAEIGSSFRQRAFLEYAERLGMILSSNMLQGYVRVGLLPKPMLRCYYSNQHVAMFNIVDRLRELLEIWEIRQLLLPLHEQTNLREGAPSVAEWLYPHLQRSTGSARIGRLKELLEAMIREATELTLAQRERLMLSLADLKDLCQALELARHQFALRQKLERRWREQRTVQLAGVEGQPVELTLFDEVLPVIPGLPVRLKQLRKR